MTGPPQTKANGISWFRFSLFPFFSIHFFPIEPRYFRISLGIFVFDFNWSTILIEVLMSQVLDINMQWIPPHTHTPYSSHDLTKCLRPILDDLLTKWVKLRKNRLLFHASFTTFLYMTKGSFRFQEKKFFCLKKKFFCSEKEFLLLRKKLSCSGKKFFCSENKKNSFCKVSRFSMMNNTRFDSVVELTLFDKRQTSLEKLHFSSPQS